MQDLNIAIIQSKLFWEEKEKNIKQFASRIQAIESTVDLIVLPEMFSTGFSMQPEKLAEPMDGVTMQWMQKMAKQYNSSIVGSLIIEENNSYYNRLIWMNTDASFYQYDKRHLFSMGGEHEHYQSGSERLIINFKGWKIIPMICYDLRFPVWFKNNYSEEKYEYDLMLNVSNWPAVRTPVWDVLLEARAIENQSYFIASNRVGEDGKGLDHIGHSKVVDYKGKVMVQAHDDAEETIFAHLSYEKLIDFREKFLLGKDWDQFKLL